MVTLCIFPLFIALLDSTNKTKLKHVCPVDSINAIFRRYLCLMVIGAARSMLLVILFRRWLFRSHHWRTVLSTAYRCFRSVVTLDLLVTQQSATAIITLVVKNNTKTKVRSMLGITSTRESTCLVWLCVDVNVKNGWCFLSCTTLFTLWTMDCWLGNGNHFVK